MKRKLAISAIIVVVICVATVLLPMTSRAAVTPAFIVVNDTLLPFNDDNMPYMSEGNIFVPHRIMERLGVYSVSSAAQEQVKLYKGTDFYVDFHTTAGGVTEDREGKVLPWPSARRIGSIFYVPLRQVCDYFGLKYESFEVGSDVLPQEMWGIRIMSSQGFSGVNIPTFISINKNALREAYDKYYSPATSSPSTSSPALPPDGVSPSPPTEEPKPSYVNVTIHLSFSDLSAGNAERILDMLDSVATEGFEACFFVNAADITGNPGLIRRISGSGYSIGIWLEKGTFDEYKEVSSLLYEAAKIKTLLVTAFETEDTAIRTADARGLLYWGASWCSEIGEIPAEDTEAEPEDPEDEPQQSFIDILPTASGERCNLRFACTEESASMLPDLISYLRDYEYTIARITETVSPIR